MLFSAKQLIRRSMVGRLTTNRQLSTKSLVKINLAQYIDSVKDTLKPPVANKLLFGDQLKVMIVGGPNQRRDFHVEMGEELFYQVKGGMDLDIVRHNKTERLHIAEGEMFLLPAGIPHSPQRYANSIGVVFERERYANEVDCLRWYTENGEVEYEEYFNCTDLGTQIKEVIERYQKLCSNGTLLPPKLDPLLDVSQLELLGDACANNIKPSWPLSGLMQQLTSGKKHIFDSEFKVQVFGGCEEAELHQTAADDLNIDYYLWQLNGTTSINDTMGNTLVELCKGDVSVVKSKDIGGLIKANVGNESYLLVVHNIPGIHSLLS